MFVYDKKLQYPIKIAKTDPRLASIIISQYGGPYINRLQKPIAGEANYLSCYFIIPHSACQKIYDYVFSLDFICFFIPKISFRLFITPCSTSFKYRMALLRTSALSF